MGTPASTPRQLLRLFVVTERPAVRALFGHFDAEADGDGDADVAVVDVSLDPAAAIERCRDLRLRRPDLPIVGVVCCSSSVSAWSLRALLASGVSAVFDLQGTEEDAVRTVETVARGNSVLHLQLPRGQLELLRELLTAGEQQSESQLRLLELVAQGLSDREIGLLLHLSPHTIKHHLDELRRGLGVRNRTELAAWAGRNGFYVPVAGARPALVPVHLVP